MSLFKPFNDIVAKLRKDYGRGSLSRTEALPNPLLQFDEWFKQAQAANLTEPHSMTLATVSSQLRPSTRVVLMKGYDDQGIRWFTNYHSRKGQELAGNPYCALQFYWDALERVVRIEGRAEKLSGEENEAYFQSRPLASRLGAWASPQSQVVQGRSFLMAQAARAAVEWGLTPPCPPHWGGYRLVPDVYEFWQGRPSRLHDRLRYRLNERWNSEGEGGQQAVWVCERLAP